MSRLLQVDVLTAQGEVQVSCRKLLVDAQIEQHANLFTKKKYLISNLPSSQKFLLASKSQKYAATYYSKAVLKPEPKKKNLWDLPKRSPIYFKISPRLLSHLGRYFFHQP